MALIITDNQHYSDIASAIRTKLGTNETFAPAEMASAIMSISGGGEVIQDQEGYIVLPSDDGGGGGGGDSGILSEIFPICAKVTFVVSGVEEGHFPTFTEVGISTGELLVDYGEYGWHFSPDEFTVTNGTFEYYLITPYADPELDYDKSSWDVSVSGGAELGEDGEYAWVMVSGDCTITATKR